MDGNLAALRQYEHEQDMIDRQRQIEEDATETIVDEALQDHHSAALIVEAVAEDLKTDNRLLIAALRDIALNPDTDSSDPRYAARAAPRHDEVARLIRRYVEQDSRILIDDEIERMSDV